MKNSKKYCIVLVSLLCFIFQLFLSVDKVRAAYTYKGGSDATIDKIIKYNATQAIGLFKDHTNVLTVKDFLHYGLNNGFYDKDSCSDVPVPNTIMSGSSSASPTLSCWDFWYGNNDWSALIKGEKSNSDPSTNDAVSYLEQLGYTQDAVDLYSGGEKCFKVTWTDPNQTSGSGNAGNFESNTLCAELDDDGYMWGAWLNDGDESKNPSPDSSRQYSLKRDWSGGAFSSQKWYVYLNLGSGYNPRWQVVVEDNNKGKKWTEFESEFKSKLDESNRTASGITSNLSLVTTSTGVGNVSGQVTNDTGFTRNSSQKVISYSGDVLLSEAEVYNIYAKYLTNSSKVKLSCDDSYDYDGDNTYDWISVQLKRNGKIDNTCHVRELSQELYTGGQRLSGTYDPVTNTLSGGGYLFTKRNMSLADIVKAVNKMNLENLEGEIDDFTGAVESGDPNGGNSKDDLCYNAGVEGMSWILCPTIDNTANAVDGIESVLRGWLQIDTNQIFRSQTYDAWNVFRNIANALIIIVLLMIIFSQLTGVGIDNYGIKKMLPRLVIMAILINLSYIVCELAVDLSNILGVGLNNMFESIGTAIRGGNGAAAETVATIVDALLATLAGAGAAASAVITIVGIAEGGGVMLIISLVLVLLVALVAVLMFFVMLGARMVIVIMFTVIAPVAFACYILPNTQNLFKKWWKVFQAALVIFPICGALYGMSFVIKAIIFGGGDVDFMMALIAVCVPFLPFLLLPTLLRGALAGLGALGGTLTMMGNGLRQGLSGGNTALKNTDRYKNALERNAENRTRFRAGLNRQGKEIEMGRFGRFVRGGDRGVARARMQYVKDQNKRAIEDRMVEPGSAGFEAALISQQKAAEGDMVKDYMTLINSRTNNGENETELGRMLASYVGSGNKMGAVAVARIAGRRKDTASGFLNKYFNDTGEYSSELREALAKEIATGENSANYRESSPFGFEFAAQINKGSKNDDGSPITDYAGWLGHQDANGSYDNVHRAMNNYVTNSKDLVGMKGGALKELARLMREGGIDASDAERLRGVARDAIRNRGTTGVWDSTKEQQIYEIAGLPYPPVDTSAGRRSGGSGGGNVPSGYTQTDSGLIIPH